MDLARAVLLAGAAGAAGAINAIAGGGTLVSFPAAIAAGLPPIVANASNAVALTPAALFSAWGYRRELEGQSGVLRVLALPALLGGVVGAALLLITPHRVFDFVVPLLVLGATALLLFQNLRPGGPNRLRSGSSTPAQGDFEARPVLAAVLQFLVAVYGGYFGAGMGILMLALLSLVVPRDIHRMNAVKIVIGAVTNGVASLGFLAAGAVDLQATVIMMLGGALGGFGGAALGRRVEPRSLRWAVVAIGLVLSGQLAWRMWFR